MTRPSPSPAAAPVPRPLIQRRQRRTLAIVVSLAAHLGLLPLLFLATTSQPTISPTAEQFDAIAVTLTPPPPRPKPDPPPIHDARPDAGAAAAAPSDAPEKPAPPVAAPRPRPAPPPAPRTRAARPVPANVETVVASTPPSPVTFVGVSDAELGGATVAGSGSGTGAGAGSSSGTGSGSGNGSGGPCDMVRRIQDALRGDADIRQTAAAANRTLGRNRALLLWNGDWLQSPGQDGKGLAGVRQAIAIEVAFAPPECRRQPMRGFALITLGDAPGSPRIALGAAHWRWSDLSGGRP